MFVHIVHGFGNFSVKAFRARALMKGIAKNHRAQHKVPTEADLLRWTTKAMGKDGEGAAGSELATAAIT